MARLARLSIPGQVHLLTQRVQPGQSVFADPVDRRAYLQCLGEAAAKLGVALHGYGLAPAEVRLLATPPDAQALGHMVQFIGRRFVAGFNRRHARRGALWEGRFRSTILEPAEYFLPCLRYVEGLAESAAPEPDGGEPPWSSADHHAGRRADTIVTEHAQFWALGNTPFEREAAYRKLAQRPLVPSQAEGIALASLQGWALGSEQFVRFLGARVERRLRPLSPGRPALAKTTDASKLSGPN
jgi:putative transposase